MKSAAVRFNSLQFVLISEDACILSMQLRDSTIFNELIETAQVLFTDQIHLFKLLINLLTQMFKHVIYLLRRVRAKPSSLVLAVCKPDLLALLGLKLPCLAETVFSLWCLWSAPLLMSNDLGKIPPASKKLLQNTELLAVNQDALGRMASRFSVTLGAAGAEGAGQGWRKDLANGDVAVVLFNPGESATKLSFDLVDAGFAPDTRVPAACGLPPCATPVDLRRCLICLPF